MLVHSAARPVLSHEVHAWKVESVQILLTASILASRCTYREFAITLNLGISTSRARGHRPRHLQHWRLERHQIDTIDIVYTHDDR